jgi:hypothetical protein
MNIMFPMFHPTLVVKLLSLFFWGVFGPPKREEEERVGKKVMNPTSSISVP